MSVLDGIFLLVIKFWDGKVFWLMRGEDPENSQYVRTLRPEEVEEFDRVGGESDYN